MFVKLLTALSIVAAAPAMAGPVIIAGTDSDDHGFVSGGVNQTGWAFMQKAFENLGSSVTNGNKTIVCIGCNGSTASASFASATSLSSLAGGWTFQTVSTLADIAAFFNGTGAINISNTGILYMPTVENNVGGGISDSQLAVVNANASAFDGFITAGGGLFTQEQANSSIGYGWLSALVPAFEVLGDNSGGIWDSGTLQLTAAGSAAFPGLTNGDMSNATPWHAYFRNFGALQALAVGNGDNVGGLNDAVVIGGQLRGGLSCGQPGAPACPTDVPEPASLPLLAVGAFGFLAWRRKRAQEARG
jgi:hypothetical protein